MSKFSLLAQTFEDDTAQVPLGKWIEEIIDWLIQRFGGIFDAIERPVDQALGLMQNAAGQFIGIPRWVAILVFALAAYVGGGVKRAAYVTAAIGFLALLGNTAWDASMQTLFALIVVLVAVGLLTGAINSLVGLAVADRDPHTLRWYRRVLMGWSWLHPFGLMLPAVFFFGIGETASVTVAIFMILPVTLTASAPQPGVAGLLQGLRASVFPATLLLGILAIIGMSGLGQQLFRGLSNQSIPLGSQAMVALWLIGFAVWAVLGPWSFDHLRGGGDKTEAASFNSPAEELAHVGGAVDLQG